jgi:hypothetical protein
MSLLREIQDAAASDEVPVATLLRKAKILAARLRHEPLRRWVESELDGYAADAELPDYRRLRDLDVKADFSGPFNSGMRNANVPPACIDEADREALFSADNRQGIAALEDLLRSKEHTFSSPWPGDAVVKYADRVYEMMGMMAAHRVIPRGAIVGAVDGVRNRLLSFSLELEQLAPEAGEADVGEAAPAPSQVTHIFNSTIYGGQAVIAGHSVDRTTLSADQPAEWPALRERLVELGLPDDELAELADALARDGGVGPETQSWLGRLAGKAATGALTLGGGVTVEVVALEVAKALGVT